MLEKKIGISKCIYYSNLDVLYMAGYALPRAERCEIWNGENLVCQAQVGIRRQDLLKQKPEYDEEYAGWDIAVHMGRDIPAKVCAKVYYEDGTWLELEKEVSCQIYEREYAETEAWYMGKQCMLEVSGVTGAKTQRIEIWNAQECLGTVSEWEKTERKFGVTSIPFRSWRIEIRELPEMPAQVYLRFFDEADNVVEKEMETKKWSALLNKRAGMSECIYYSNLDVLYMAGYALPRAERCEIWNGENLVCQAQVGIRRQDLLKQKPEYDEEYAGWDIAVHMGRDIPAKVCAKVYYEDGTWLELEKEVSCQIYEREYAETEAWYMGKQCILEVSGVTGAKTQRIEIWNAQECLGTVSEWEKTERKFGVTSIPFRSWRIEIRELPEMPAQVYLRFFDEADNVVEKEMETKKWSALLNKRAGMSECIYYSNLDVLYMAGYALPRAERCEIWNGENLVCQAQVGIRRQDLLKQKPEYDEEYAGWGIAVYMGRDIPAKVCAKVYYEDGTWLELEKEVSCQIYEREYAETEAWYMGKQCMLEVSGVTGAKTQRIEIWNAQECLGTVSEWEKTERKFGVTSIPFRSWRIEIRELPEMPAQVYLRFFDEADNIVEKELKTKKWSVPLDKRIGISKCIYYSGAARLLVQGWSLSRVADCGIYIEDNFYGNAQLDLPREDILEKHTKYEWDAPGWNAIVAYDGKSDAVIELRFNFFDGNFIKVESTIKEIVAIEKIECQECVYLPNAQRLLISGKALNLDNNIQIWNDGKYIGEIKREDYQKSDELGRNIWKKCFHNVKIGSNTICLKEQNYVGGESFYGEVTVCDSAEKVQDSGIFKLTVNKAEYIPVVDQIQLIGWCLPVPEKIEVVVEGRREECELLQLRNDVYMNMKWYNEKRSGWSCTIHNIDQPVQEVILKIYYGEGDFIEQVVLIKALEKKLISFDMFDTLVERPVLEPINLLKLVAKRCGLPYQFVYMRTNAERFARENNQRTDREVDLDDIYAALALILRRPPEELEIIKQTEIEVELQYLRVKQSGKLFYEKALRENKDIVIVTDMYLPKEVIEKCLENNGYVQYKKIYLSQEYRTSKSDGGLYDIMIAEAMENGILPGEILHIGDNRQVDMVMAKQKGLDAVIERKSIEKLRENELAASFFGHSAGDADNCFLKGFWANYMASLDTEERKGTDTRYMRLGAIFAPVLIAFTIWMLNDCHERGCDKIVWVYRDGYLFEKIAKILAPYMSHNIDSKKIYLSRAIRYNGHVEEENGFFQAWIDYPVYKMKVKDFVENRLLVDQEQEKDQVLDMIFRATGKCPEDSIGDILDYIEIFAQMEDIYIRHAQENMEVVRKYCWDVLGDSNKIAVFDIGYQGKSANFLRMVTKKDIVTYQLLGKDLIGESIDNKSYIRYSNRFFDNLRILHPIFEDIISSPENTTKRIRMVNGEFLREVGGKTIENGVISRIQEEILKFTAEFVELFGKDVMNLRFEHFPEYNLACDFLIKPCRELAEIIAQFEFGDSEFLNKVEASIYRDWYDEKIVQGR